LFYFKYVISGYNVTITSETHLQTFFYLVDIDSLT